MVTRSSCPGADSDSAVSTIEHTSLRRFFLEHVTEYLTASGLRSSPVRPMPCGWILLGLGSVDGRDCSPLLAANKLSSSKDGVLLPLAAVLAAGRTPPGPTNPCSMPWRSHPIWGTTALVWLCGLVSITSDCSMLWSSVARVHSSE